MSTKSGDDHINPYGVDLTDVPSPEPALGPMPGVAQGDGRASASVAPSYPQPWPTHAADGKPDWSRYKQPNPGRAALIAIAVGAVVLIAVIALLVSGTIGLPSRSGGTPPAPTGPPPTGHSSRWGEPINIGLVPRYVLDIGLDDIAVVVSRGWDPALVAGVNLATKEVVWTQMIMGFGEPSGDDTGLVMPSSSPDDELVVVDPRTGEITATFDAGLLLWAGGGFILTKEGHAICARAMSDPGQCVWTAPHTNLSIYGSDPPKSLYVFGDGRWVNTDDGVRDLATGSAAGFGGDAAGGVRSVVYYAGSASRVFRVENTDDFQVWKHQPWDVATDKAVSSEVLAGFVVADESSQVYLAYTAQSDQIAGDTVSGIDWETGDRLWDTTFGSATNRRATYVDGMWLVDINSSLVALDAATGTYAWQRGHTTLVARRDNLILTSTLGDFTVYDSANEFGFVLGVSEPAASDVHATAKHTFCTHHGGWLWVLDG